jgi:beta-galactosidase
LSSWSWPGSEGAPLTIRLYTMGDRVELHLNGRLLGSKPVTAADLKHVEFTANYEPGVLEAVAFLDGGEIARRRLTTVGAATAIRLTPERPSGGRNRGDVSYVAMEVVDAAGRTVLDSNRKVDLTISGPAELIAFGSANPLAVGSLQSASAQTWNGRALAIVRGRGTVGQVRFEASSEGLKKGTATVRLI